MAKGSIPKYSKSRWVPRVGQVFAVAAWENIHESKRQDFVHDAYLPYVFRNKEQVRTMRAYMASILELREKYGLPIVGKDYILVTWKGIESGESFGDNLFDWYLYENGFILPQTVPTEEVSRHSAVVRNYLAVVEDMYIDEYWKYKMSRTPLD